jgi:hypothetical protein
MSMSEAAVSVQVSPSAARHCHENPKRHATIALTIPAAPAEQQEAHDRHVSIRGDRRVAVRAGRSGPPETESIRIDVSGHLDAAVARAVRLFAPGDFHHDRQSIDDHVDEASDQQAQDSAADRHEPRERLSELTHAYGPRSVTAGVIGRRSISVI